jgi:glycosyltransferase involved in cell wall biosynthesis
MAADLFVLPGPGGLSINQAMAYGLPVVVWGGDGTERDLLQAGEAGFVVDSYTDLLARTEELATNSEMRLRLGRNALRVICKYDLTNMVDQFCRAFDFVLRKRAN